MRLGHWGAALHAGVSSTLGPTQAALLGEASGGEPSRVHCSALSPGHTAHCPDIARPHCLMLGRGQPHFQQENFQDLAYGESTDRSVSTHWGTDPIAILAFAFAAESGPDWAPGRLLLLCCPSRSPHCTPGCGQQEAERAPAAPPGTCPDTDSSCSWSGPQPEPPEMQDQSPKVTRLENSWPH